MRISKCGSISKREQHGVYLNWNTSQVSWCKGKLTGPIIQAAIAMPLSSRVVTSAMVPPPKASGLAPKQPWKNRNTIKEFMSFATPQATVKMMKKTLQMWYRGRRPYISERGAITVRANGPIRDTPAYNQIEALPKGPKAKPRT